MSDTCSPTMPGGVNIDCVSPLRELENVFILDKTETFTDIDDLKSKATWIGKISTDLDVYIPQGLENYEPTTPDANVETTAMGSNYVGAKPPPAMTMYLKLNPCDYNELLNTLDGGVYGIVFAYGDGKLGATRPKSNKTVYPYKARLTAITKGIPAIGDVGSFFMVMVHFQAYSEFENAVYVLPSWSPTELKAEMPMGLNLSIVTPYTDATDLVVVKVTERCGAAKTGLLAAAFVTIETSLTGATVSAATDNSNGTYDLTIDTGGTTGLTAANYSVIQVQNGTPKTDVSNQLYIQGGA